MLPPAAISTNDCRPDTPASVTDAVAPNYPAIARHEDVPPSEAIIRVTVAADGKPVNVVVARSSGRSDFDQASLQAAKESKYSAKIAHCVPVEGDYLFKAGFFPDDTLRFLDPPAFSAPADWQRSKDVSVPEGFKSLYEWTHGAETLGVMGGYTLRSLSEAVNAKSQLIENSRGTVRESKPVRLCAGRADGWELEYEQGVTHYLEVLELGEADRLYDVYYYGPTAPDESVRAAAISVCGV